MQKVSWGDLGTWALAFLLAVGIWFFVNAGARTSERTLQVRLDLINLPGGMVIAGPVPDYVEVRVSGSGLMLSSIDANGLRTSLDLAGVRPGVATYALNARDFPLPRSVDINRMTPSRISLLIDRLERRKLPVQLDYRGELAPGLKVSEAQVLPAEVAVTGPSAKVAALEHVDTAALDRTGLVPGVNEQALDLLGPGGLVQLRRASVMARVLVERELGERVFDDVGLEIKGEADWIAKPERLRIVVRGPATELVGLALAPGAAYVDGTSLPAGEAVEVRPLVTLPPGYEIVRLEPPLVVLEPVVEPVEQWQPYGPQEAGADSGLERNAQTADSASDPEFGASEVTP